MTELEQKAKFYADEHFADKDELTGEWLFDEEMLRRAYLAGAKEIKKENANVHTKRRKNESIEIQPIKKISKECLNCGTKFLIEPYVIQDFCNRCFLIVCKAVFDEANGDLTCKQLIEKLKQGK